MIHMELSLQIDRRSLLGATVGAASLNVLLPRGAAAAVLHGLRVASPIETGGVTSDAMGFVTYPDTVVLASKTFAFAGTYTGAFKNMMIAVPGVAPWGSVKMDGKGRWTSMMDLSGVRTGPLNVRIMAWYDDPAEKQISLDFTLLIDNPAVRRAELTAPAPAAGMKLQFADDFDALPDTSRWGFGVRPDGSQWGSNSHFQTKDETLSDVFQLPMPSCLRIRALYDANYIDPQGWNRKWRSGMLCTAFSDGRPPAAAFRKGYVEMRAILPLGKGMWPSMWGESLGSDNKSLAYPNHLEVDGIEAYDEVGNPGAYKIANNVILWTERNKSDGVNRQTFTKDFDASSDWHTYGCLVEDGQATNYIDGVKTYTIQIPTAASKNPLFWMFDNALGGGWPVTVPPAKFVDMWIDYVRLYSAD